MEAIVLSLSRGSQILGQIDAPSCSHGAQGSLEGGVSLFPNKGCRVIKQLPIPQYLYGRIQNSIALKVSALIKVVFSVKCNFMSLHYVAFLVTSLINEFTNIDIQIYL